MSLQAKILILLAITIILTTTNHQSPIDTIYYDTPPVEEITTSSIQPEIVVKPEPVDPFERAGTYKITCYRSGTITARGCSVQEGLALAYYMGLDGICAVGRHTPWYYLIREENPPILLVEGRGVYLAIDRIGHGSDIDIYDINCGRSMWIREYKRVTERN